MFRNYWESMFLMSVILVIIPYIIITIINQWLLLSTEKLKFSTEKLKC